MAIKFQRLAHRHAICRQRLRFNQRTWRVFLGHRAGNSITAFPNAGYFATNNVVPLTVTLPTSPRVGDVYRVSGVGGAGWVVAQNTSQAILSGNLAGVIGWSWTPRASIQNWYSVASSADGTKLIAVSKWWPALHLDRFRGDLDPARHQLHAKLGFRGILGQWRHTGGNRGQQFYLYFNRLRRQLDTARERHPELAVYRFFRRRDETGGGRL